MKLSSSISLCTIILFAVIPLLDFGQVSADKTSPATSQASSENGRAASSKTAAADASPETLARKYIELWNASDPAIISSFPPFILHRHGSRFAIGPDKLSKEIALWRTSMPDLKFNIDDVIAQGDKVVARLTFTGTYKERMFAETPDPASPPRPVRATEMLIFQVKDGKIKEIWEEYDELALRTQMGASWRTKQEIAAANAAGSAPPTTTPAPEPTTNPPQKR